MHILFVQVVYERFVRAGSVLVHTTDLLAHPRASAVVRGMTATTLADDRACLQQ